MPGPGAIVVKQRQDMDRETFRLSTMLLRHGAEGEELPAIVLEPKSWNKQAVIWISKEGKQSLLDAEGNPRGPVRRLLAAGMAVVGIDLLGQGEFSIDGKPPAKARLNRSGGSKRAAYAGYTFGYNYPIFAQRVHDVLSAVSFARNTLGAAKVHLVGLGGAGHWVLAARAQAREAIGRAAADTAGFRFAQDHGHRRSRLPARWGQVSRPARHRGPFRPAAAVACGRTSCRIIDRLGRL